jgi:hypothetical protein
MVEVIDSVGNSALTVIAAHDLRTPPKSKEATIERFREIDRRIEETLARKGAENAPLMRIAVLLRNAEEFGAEVGFSRLSRVRHGGMLKFRKETDGTYKPDAYDVERLREIMAELLDPSTAVVKRCGGTLKAEGTPPHRGRREPVQSVRTAANGLERRSSGWMAVDVDGGAKTSEHFGHQGDVENVGRIGDRAGALCQQGRSHQLQHAVLGTTHGNFARQPGTTGHYESLAHAASLSSADQREPFPPISPGTVSTWEFT